MSDSVLSESLPTARELVPDEALPLLPVAVAADEFKRDVSASLVAEFRRLAILSGWKKKSKPYKEKRRELLAAWVTEDFEEEFGANKDSLKAWQKLCRHLGVGENLPLGSTTECHRALHGIYVNLVDLVDSYKTQTRPRIFASSEELAKYIRNTGKVFPIDQARYNPLLREFLVHVHLQVGGRKPRRRRRGRRKANAAKAT
ncbi:hypothetical protein BD414DRAFT_539848 [Trametes punicea]|nr:hypothetical protein BD414DRAFT_539848 [Trametes punicea]